MKTLKLTKKEFELVYYSSEKWEMLSTVYYRRTTNYNRIYNGPLFEIIKDKFSIISLGFHPRTAAVFRLNLENESVKEVLELRNKLRSNDLNLSSDKAYQLYIENSVDDCIKSVAEARAAKKNKEEEAYRFSQKIKIDEDFISDINESKKMTSFEKSDFQASAFKKLIERNALKIEQPIFWDVFRIVKSKV